MARKKSTAASTETSEATSETQATEAATVETAASETSEAAQAESKAASTETSKTASETQAGTSEAASYTVTWAKMAGKTIKGLKGVLITFDADGKATVDAENAKRLLKIRGVVIQGA